MRLLIIVIVVPPYAEIQPASPRYVFWRSRCAVDETLQRPRKLIEPGLTLRQV
jgi:hypothetical protein